MFLDAFKGREGEKGVCSWQPLTPLVYRLHTENLVSAWLELHQSQVSGRLHTLRLSGAQKSPSEEGGGGRKKREEN